MAPQTARSFMKDFRNSFRRKKVVDTSKTGKGVEDPVMAKLRELKEAMGDNLLSIYHDEDLIGFLRARSMDVNEAKKLLKLDINVRRILRVEEYQPSPEIHPYNISGVIGFSKDGCLVRVMNVGECDANGIVHRLSTIEIFKILLLMVNSDMALQEAENRKNDRSVREFIYILNVETLSMQQISCKPALDTAMQSLKLMQDHLHDLLRAIYVVNAPAFFSSVFRLFKPVIQDSLQEKIKILDAGNDELLKVIDEDTLPKYLGGNRVDSNGDPNCSEFIHWGFMVPESSYASNFLNPNDPDVITVTIPAGEKLNFKFPVHELGSIAKWHIQSKDYDLAICVLYEPFQSEDEATENAEDELSNAEVLTPILRCQCHVCPEEGSTVLWFTGNFILQLDNSYSWMNPKEATFKISVLPPKESEKNASTATDLMKELSLAS